MLPEENNSALTDSSEDDGLIEFIAPETEHLTIVKAAEVNTVERPKIVFSDELIPQFQLGVSDIRIELSHLVMLQQAAIALLNEAQREILIITPDLEHDRFDNDDFCEALSAFVRSSRYTNTRILIADPQLAIEDGHRVVKLMRRISSLIEIRQLHEHDIQHIQAVMILIMWVCYVVQIEILGKDHCSLKARPMHNKCVNVLWNGGSVAKKLLTLES